MDTNNIAERAESILRNGVLVVSLPTVETAVDGQVKEKRVALLRRHCTFYEAESLAKSFFKDNEGRFDPHMCWVQWIPRHVWIL